MQPDRETTIAAALDRMRRQHDVGVRSLENLSRLIRREVSYPEYLFEDARLGVELEALRHG